jgi:hypothetical protein
LHFPDKLKSVRLRLHRVSRSDPSPNGITGSDEITGDENRPAPVVDADGAVPMKTE